VIGRDDDDVDVDDEGDNDSGDGRRFHDSLFAPFSRPEKIAIVAVLTHLLGKYSYLIDSKVMMRLMTYLENKNIQ